jgi:hypothetical protein
METKHARPDFVRNFIKPKNTEIKLISGQWYLYERASKYDPETSKMLGSITEQGFVGKRVCFSVSVGLGLSSWGLPSTSMRRGPWFAKGSGRRRVRGRSCHPSTSRTRR